LIAGAGGDSVSDIRAAADSGGGTGGIVDCQVNGAAGVDLTRRPEDVWRVAAALGGVGVAAFLPTLVSPNADEVARALDALAAGPPAGDPGADVVGWHLEGPVLNPARAGAHDPARLRRPGDVDIDRWHPRTGVRMVTLAPELPGALELTAELAGRGIVVSLGHTEADEPTVERAVDAGARCVTHLFNAMSPLHHRRPGVVGAVLGGAPLVASLIGDGVHVAPAVFRAAWRALGADRRMLVSDCVAAALMPPGDFSLAGTRVTSDGRSVRDRGGGLAGSALTLPEIGIPREEVLEAATRVPRRLLGI